MSESRKQREKDFRKKALKVLEVEYKDKMYRRTIKIGGRNGKEEMFDVVNFDHKVAGECLYIEETRTGIIRKSWEDKILAKLFKLFLISKDYRRILFIPKNSKGLKKEIISRYGHFMRANTEIREI